MTDLAQHLKDLIEQTGPMTIATFMTEALSHPKFGYYMRGDPLGTAGDFITAPEISQTFGELIGVWLIDCWRKQGSPSPIALCELGPGRGTLMADLLRAARSQPDFVSAIQIHLVEISPTLRERQRQTLSPQKVHWHAGHDTVPAGRPLFLIANEFFDALPILSSTLGS